MLVCILQRATMSTKLEKTRTQAVESLFEPGSVAVVGASAEPGKWGQLLARGALAGAHRRSVHLVNRRGGEILGRPAFERLADLPAPPELVVVSVPPDGFAAAVDEALDAGARAIVGITSGLAPALESALVGRVRAEGAVLLGPNCLGVYDGDAELRLAPGLDVPPGEIGLVAQSGNLALELGLLARRAGLGFSRFASLGNQADLQAADLLASLAAHEPTRLVALYLEDFRDGRTFARAAQAAVAIGKPVVLLAPGSSEAGARAARSHTGALVSDSAAVDAVCRAAGIVRVSTPAELVRTAAALLRGRRLGGRRIAVFGDGGGHGVIAADLAARAGLALPQLSDGVRAQLGAVLPPSASTANPVDFAGGEDDLGRFERVTRILLGSGEVDALLLTGYFGGYGGEVAELEAHELEVATALADAAQGRLVVHTLYPDSAAARALGALVYREIEQAVDALALLATPFEPRPIPELPDPRPIPAAADYFASRALVAAAGIGLPEARHVRTVAEARAAAAELGPPLVLKRLGESHKSDGDGVALGLAEDDVAAAFARLGPDCSLERLEPSEGGIELIVGVRRDPRFGPLLLVGLGGVHAEVLADFAIALAPLDAGGAEELLRSLRGAPLLLGARGRPPVELRAAADAAAALSELAAAAPAIRELEVNPLLVRPDGAVALDARVVLSD
jgi:acetate---CoA ligase (ADP-forming)